MPNEKEPIIKTEFEMLADEVIVDKVTHDVIRAGICQCGHCMSEAVDELKWLFHPVKWPERELKGIIYQARKTIKGEKK